MKKWSMFFFLYFWESFRKEAVKNILFFLLVAFGVLLARWDGAHSLLWWFSLFAVWVSLLCIGDGIFGAVKEIRAFYKLRRDRYPSLKLLAVDWKAREISTQIDEADMKTPDSEGTGSLGEQGS